MKNLFALAGLMLCTSVALAWPQLVTPDDDLGTLPAWEPIPMEFTHYLVVQGPDADYLHGLRVVHLQLGGRAQYVYEFAGLNQMMQPLGGGTVPSVQVGSTFSDADDVPGSVVFPDGSSFELFVETEETSLGSGVLVQKMSELREGASGGPQYSCTTAPCSQPNSSCTGYCDTFGFWQCVCTQYNGNSRETARKHQKKLDAHLELYPKE